MKLRMFHNIEMLKLEAFSFSGKLIKSLRA